MLLRLSVPSPSMTMVSPFEDLADEDVVAHVGPLARSVDREETADGHRQIVLGGIGQGQVFGRQFGDAVGRDGRQGRGLVAGGETPVDRRGRNVDEVLHVGGSRGLQQTLGRQHIAGHVRVKLVPTAQQAGLGRQMIDHFDAFQGGRQIVGRRSSS